MTTRVASAPPKLYLTNYILPADILRLLLEFIPEHMYYTLWFVPAISTVISVPYTDDNNVIFDAISKNDIQYCIKYFAQLNKISGVYYSCDSDTYKDKWRGIWCSAIRFGRVDILNLLETTDSDYRQSVNHSLCWMFGNCDLLYGLAPNMSTIDWLVANSCVTSIGEWYRIACRMIANQHMLMLEWMYKFGHLQTAIIASKDYRYVDGRSMSQWLQLNPEIFKWMSTKKWPEEITERIPSFSRA
jgi:hypothetical protein